MINLADIVAASNGLYDNVVNVINWGPPIAIAMLVSWICAMLFSVLRGSSLVLRNSKRNLIYTLLCVLFTLNFIADLVFLVGPKQAAIESNPSIVDVVETCYNLDVISMNDKEVATHHIVDHENFINTSVNAVFNNNGQVLNAVVVVDDNSNVYVINTDTNQIVEPVVSDSPEIAGLLEEKFQS